MYSSLSLSKRLLLIHVLAIQLLLISSELSLNTTNAYLNHKCLVSEGKYKPGSKYDELLKSTIRMFYVDSNNKQGFTLSGDSTLSAILQCRGDSYGTKCQHCFTTALAELRRRCPMYKGRMIWYDQCLLAISTYEFIGKIDYDNSFCMSNVKKVGGDSLTFTRTWKTLMDKLATLATVGEDANYTSYAAGETRYKGDMLYAMVQCTSDLSPEACKECLVFNNVHFQDCLDDKRGARVVSRSCIFRFEFYPFIAKHVQNNLRAK